MKENLDRGTSGGTVKNFVRTVCVGMGAVLALAGCGPATTEPATPVSPSSAIATNVDFTISEESTCKRLLVDNGPMHRNATFLMGIEGLSDEAAKEAENIASGLAAAADTASERLKKLLTVMQEPLIAIAEAHHNGTSFHFNSERTQAASTEIVSICDSLSPARSEAKTAKPSEPKGIPTSGNYAADIAAHGLVPDDLEYYKEFMKESLCDSELGSSAFLGRVRSRVGSPTDPKSDRANLARVNVAYLCPERTEDLEQTLTQLAAE